MQGYPHEGADWEEFLQKQRGVHVTCDKIENELKNAIRFNSDPRVGGEFPLDAAIEVIARLLDAVEDIKHTTIDAVHDLPEKVRDFNRMAQEHSSVNPALREVSR